MPTLTSIYTIKQAADKLNLSVATLHYYEREGLIHDITRLPNGHRRYSDEDVAWVEFLHCMRESGMPIRDLKRYVELSQQRGTGRERCTLLVAHREAVIAEIDTLNGYLSRIDAKIVWYREALARLDAEQAQDGDEETG